MGNRNDIDTDLTRRFDMEELRREMAREERQKRARVAAQNRASSMQNTGRTGTGTRTTKTRETSGRINSQEIRYSNQRAGRNNNVKSKKKKTTKFKKNLKKYIICLSVLSLIFLGYVMNTLYQYEDSFTDNYMASVVKDVTKKAKKGKISKLIDTKSIEINKLDNSGKKVNDVMKQIFKNSEITYKLDENTKNTTNPTYYVFANNQKVLQVNLKEKVKKHRLGLFTYPIWEVENYKLATDRGLEYFDVYVPSNYTVEVNGTKLGEEYISKKTVNEDYDKFKEYVKLPNMVNYELNNFLQVPAIKIKDEKGNEVDTLITNNKIEIANSAKTANTYEEAKKNLTGDIDIMKLAENWSLFLTDDLKGGTQHGFSLLKPYLIKNSNFYNMAYAWATSIDITFVSNHTLKNPAFTNESLKDFVIYSDKAFSCSVYLEKNMRIANGKDKTDIMHDKLYFVYYDDSNDGVDNPSWKLIDMKSIVE